MNQPVLPEKKASFRHPRFRDTFMWIGGMLVIILFVLADPNNNIIENIPLGASTIVLLQQLLKSIWFIGMLHCGTRALFDYLDKRQFFIKAQETPHGAGLALIAVSIAMLGVSVCIAAAVLSN